MHVHGARRAWLLTAAIVTGCGDTVSPADGTTSADVGTSTSSTTANADDTSTAGVPSCAEGSWGCACRDGDDPCDADLLCTAGTCDECPIGLLGCACSPSGVCAEPLVCVDGSCIAAPGACPRASDGECDEPEAGGECERGSDPFDCCANPRDGTCDERTAGGVCPPGSDHFDCGHCPSQSNGQCDEPRGTGACPADSDPFDCCATQKDGTCEERSQGGRCGDGSDFFDCGWCPGANDGTCQEPGVCPPGSDTEDCATATGSGSSGTAGSATGAASTDTGTSTSSSGSGSSSSGTD